MKIRPENPKDIPHIFQLHKSAFETDAEARLVDKLRQEISPLISLVAEQGDNVTGHILFSPVTLSDHPELNLMGLAPMAVMPDRQNQGTGSLLVLAGLHECRKQNFDAVVVLGYPNFYPRFGFVPSSHYGIKSEYDVPDDVFMIQELSPNRLNGTKGVISYHSVFSEI